MSFVDERLAIENRLQEFWNYTPIAWENVDFDIPNNSDWIRLNILNGDSGYTALGGLKRHTGVLLIQVFTPVNTGTNKVREYSDTIANIFDSRSFSDIVCDVASVQNIGADDGFHQVNVTIPYWRDE
jgi:hypothetical protein